MIEVLIIDDDEVDRLAIKRALGRTYLDAEAIEADTATKGLALLKERNFDCVLLDYRLPDYDGLEVLAKLAATDDAASSPIVMLTGLNDDDLALKSLRAGAQDFLTKDNLTSAQLARAIINAIERQELRTQNSVIRQELKEKADFMKVIDDTMADGLLVTNGFGDIISVNKACLEIFGYSEKEMLGKSVNMLMADKDAVGHNKRLKKYIKTGKSKLIGQGTREVQGRRKNGKEFTLEIAVNPVVENDQYVFVGCIRDITERKVAEAAAKATEDRLQLITDNMSDIIILRDREGKILYVSPAMVRHLGYTVDEGMGLDSMAMIHDEDRERVESDWRETLFEKKQSFHSVVRIKHKKGHWLWFESYSEPILDEDGNVSASVTASRNITDQREAEERYKMLADHGTDILILEDADCNVIYVSPSLERHLGIKPEAAVGKNAWDLVHPDDVINVKPNWDKKLFKEKVNCISRLRFQNIKGEYIWFEALCTPILDEKNKVTAVISNCRNISDQREAEEKMTMLAENASDIIMLHGEKGEIVYITPAVTKHLGLDPANIIGKQTVGVVHPEDKKDLSINWDKEVYEKGKSVQRDLRLKNAKGDYLWFESHSAPILDENGKVVAAITTSRNISEYKEAESDALRFGRIVEDSLNEVYVFDSETWGFISVNRGGRENLGYSLDELHKMTPLDIKKEYTKASFAKLIKPLTEGKSDHMYFETVHTRKDGSTYDVEVYMQISRTGLKPVFVAIIEDVTEKKAAAESLRQAQKMEAVGNLSGGIAHDFNNLLTAIQGSLQLMEMVDDDISDDAKECLNIAIKSTKRGADLTHRLLAFSRKQTLLPSVVDVNELIMDMIPMLRRTIHESIEIETHLPAEESLVKVDISELENSLLNLTVNARDAMPDGGHLTFEVSEVDIKSAQAGERHIEPGQYVLVSVSDSGTGMPADVRDHVFEPFFSTKGVEKGTGLGLSMVYGFVKQSGGHISVYSEEGEGTTFRLYLKSTSGKKKLRKDKKKSDGLKEKGSGTILLVEDDDGVREFVTQALKAKGYNVLDVGDGPSALLVMDSDENIDLLLTDVVLPKGMSGPEIGAAFNERFPKKPIIYSSGYTGKAIEKNGWLKDGDQFLSKPYDIADLFNRVRDKLAEQKD